MKTYNITKWPASGEFTDKNHLIPQFYSNAALFRNLYGVYFRNINPANHEAEPEHIHSVTHYFRTPPANVIEYQEKGTNQKYWIREEENEIIINLLSQFRDAKGVVCGYILGTMSPYPRTTEGFYSANAHDGYQFWIQIYM